MTPERFRSLMIASKTFAGFGHAEFWAGYQRGLRRRFHGERFGTNEEHQYWMGAAARERHPERARGYRAGFEGRDPHELAREMEERP